MSQRKDYKEQLHPRMPHIYKHLAAFDEFTSGVNVQRQMDPNEKMRLEDFILKTVKEFEMFIDPPISAAVRYQQLIDVSKRFPFTKELDLILENYDGKYCGSSRTGLQNAIARILR